MTGGQDSDEGGTSDPRTGWHIRDHRSPPSSVDVPIPAGPGRHTRQLFAGGAGIHVDFHADRHFNNLRCFPGHCPLLQDGTVIVLSIKLPCYEKFASGIFLFERLRPAYCSAKSQTRIAMVFVGLSRENNEFVIEGFAPPSCSAISLGRAAGRIKRL
ncbi:protein of unknown function [Bradyrhizobium sp. ORS 285]|nr:hypothetical protein BRAO285_490031 [Bradyrhizobium sp. ORS 285]SMX56701.1 protein of unknown function [Bradyrhizobium sp. ORS 285]